jgi:hypothetical protein
LWADALRRAGVRNGAVLGIATYYFAGRDSALDDAASFVGRRSLASVYGIEESATQSVVAACCCAPCARIQEINTVMTREGGLRYGCAHLREDGVASMSSANASAAPAPVAMARIVEQRAPGRRV